MNPGIRTAALAFAVAVPLAHAQGDLVARRPASELLAACEAVAVEPDESPAATRCLAFVEGFVWGHGWAAWRVSKSPYFCPPGDGPVSARSFVPGVVAYLRAHPERLIQPAHVMLFSALSSTYPCDADAGVAAPAPDR